MFNYISKRKIDNKKLNSGNNIDKTIQKTMKRGYLEMADINLSISNLYFQVESEAYYDNVVVMSNITLCLHYSVFQSIKL